MALEVIYVNTPDEGHLIHMQIIVRVLVLHYHGNQETI